MNFFDVSWQLQLVEARHAESASALSSPSSSSWSSPPSPVLAFVSNSTGSRTPPSPPPASTSRDASLRLQALARGLHQSILAQRLNQVVEARESERGRQGQSEDFRESEDEDEDEEQHDWDDEADSDGDEEEEREDPGRGQSRIEDDHVWKVQSRAQQRFEEGLVDANGVRIQRHRVPRRSLELVGR